MRIRAFNLIPGAAFMLLTDATKRYIVKRVIRDPESETVTVRTSRNTPLAFDFCEEVYLIGLDAELGTEENVDDVGTDGYGLKAGEPVED